MHETTTSSLQMTETNTDFEVRSLDSVCINESKLQYPAFYYFIYFLTGIFFGILLIKAEVISWFRIQEMFRLQSFHMYGVIGSAVVTGMLSVVLIKWLDIRTVKGEKIIFTKKKFNKGQVYGGLIFGLGWAITGACPGPLYAQIGNGALVVVVVLLSAIAGTWVYGLLRDRLPH